MRDELSSLRQKSDQQQAVINKVSSTNYHLEITRVLSILIPMRQLIHFLLRLLYTKTERIGPVGRKRYSAVF